MVSMLHKIVLVYALLFINCTLHAQVVNPQTLPNEWDSYGIGDPYILKYKGKFWLYVSTRDDLTGVKVWSSWDLANWNYEGLCASDPITKGAYAPEVVYYNGTFYMYTSPGGRGHYILSSDSPTGPFVPRTGNLGLTIDGNVFIDDNGEMYLTYAGLPQIRIRKMSSPLAIDGPEINTNATLNEWTEGSTIFKRNGLYYMTYTGNHVISRGYRINYGTSTAPLGPYTPSNQGPLVLNTEGTWYGLGHSGTIQGPDLDTWYIAYHNKYGDLGKGPIRALNIDPHGFNGDKLVVYGPCNWSQPSPNLPSFYERWNRTSIGQNWINLNGGNWGIYNQELLYQDQTGVNSWQRQISSVSTEKNYVAEFNLKEVNRGGDNARMGVVFSYVDENNYASAAMSSFNNTLELDFIKNGTSLSKINVELLPGWNYQKWHAIRVEKKENEFKVFVDGMLKSTHTVAGFGAGKIGLTTLNDHCDFGYVAFSNHINGSGIFDFHKPIPGTIEAVHYNSGGEGASYHDQTPENTGNAYRNDGVDIAPATDGGYTIGWNDTGDWYEYNINVKAQGNYHLGFRYATIEKDRKIRFLVDGQPIGGIITLPSTTDWKVFNTYIIKNLPLPQGYHTLRVETVVGPFDIYSLKFDQAANTAAITDNFNSGFNQGWNYSDGSWSTNNGTANIVGWGKRTIGNTGSSDFTVQVDVKCPSNGNGGLVLRVKNPANGGANNNSKLGTDFYQGYYVGLQATGIQLGKQNYDWKELQFHAQNLNPGQLYNLRAEIENSRIKVYLNDILVINYFDTKPIIAGKVGLRAFDTDINFDNFNLSAEKVIYDCASQANGNAFYDACGTCADGNTGTPPILKYEDCTITGNTDHVGNSDFDIYPNPFQQQLIIKKDSPFTYEVYTMQGTIIEKGIGNNTITVGKELKPGSYLLFINTKGNHYNQVIIKE